MASKVQVIILPESHTEEGQTILHTFIPVVKEILPKDIKAILNFTEGKGTPGAVPEFYKALYAPDESFIHMYEWKETSPDFALMECIKYVLTIVTMLNAILETAYSFKDVIAVKDITAFPGMSGRPPPPNYMELVYIQMYEGQKFLPITDALFVELDRAFKDLYEGRTDAGLYNTHINTALARLIAVLEEKKAICQRIEPLQAAIHAIITGGDTNGRKKPMESIRILIREMFDERIIRKIEKYISTNPKITHVIMNIGLSHYHNTVRLIQASATLTLEGHLNAAIVEIYSKMGMGNMVKAGGSRKKKCRNKTKRRKSRRNR
jgi:hypothetical protein